MCCSSLDTCDVVGVWGARAQVNSVVLDAFRCIELVEGDVVYFATVRARHSGKALWVGKQRLLGVSSVARGEFELHGVHGRHRASLRPIVCGGDRSVEEVCRRRALSKACRNCMQARTGQRQSTEGQNSRRQCCEHSGATVLSCILCISGSKRGEKPDRDDHLCTEYRPAIATRYAAA